MPNPIDELQPGDGLLVVDVQQCFCPGGRLPVARGDEIVTELNRWLAAARLKGLPVYASRDWHPVRHPSFRDQGGPWPAHCLQDSAEAAFHPELELPEDTIIITKGVRFDQDQNSAFDQTGLADQLCRDGVGRLWVGGLALEVCVLASVLDARAAGLEVVLIADATRPINIREGERALQKMREAGVRIFALEEA